VQSGRKWLLKSHKQIPGPKLTAMGMARKLQMIPSARRRRRGARLMRQQNSYSACRRARKGDVRIAALRRVKPI
jgi:hypothetical protein